MRGALLGICIASLATHAAARPLPDTTPQGSAIAASCEDPVAERPAGGACVSTVNGKVTDPTGAPLPDRLVTVCASVCYFGKTDADGVFSVKVYSHLVVDQFATSVHGRPEHADYYLPLPSPTGDTYTYRAPLMLPRLPASGPEFATDGSARTITAGDVTLHLAAGTTVDIHIDSRMLGPIGSQLRPVRIADPRIMPFIDPAAPPRLLYGFAPFEVRFSNKTAISFANTVRLPAGSAVDVRSMSGLIGEKPPAGRFTSVASAHVSADGLRINMDPGQGVRGLTWLALFPK